MARIEKMRVTRYDQWLINSCQSPGRRSEAPARSPVRYADCLARPNYLVLHLAPPSDLRAAAQATISNASKNQPSHNIANWQYLSEPESPRLAGLVDLMRFFVIYLTGGNRVHVRAATAMLPDAAAARPTTRSRRSFGRRIWLTRSIIVGSIEAGRF